MSAVASVSLDAASNSRQSSLQDNSLPAKKDLTVGSYIKPLYFVFNDGSTFVDKKLPQDCQFSLNYEFDCNYFVSLHRKVKEFNKYNYCGARIPLKHTKLNL